uniref:GNAT family N-acetyltransferase n=1 Tax=uncultured Altererythrobacter sp. TaxID=500840 RepID=UPI002603DF11|nr:GNAT family N-acetyltransferase [uncultured Altererythrobacter sp.]
MNKTSQVDQIMAVMETAFDPQWGEAWNRRQVEDALFLPNTFAILNTGDSKNETATGFLITRHAPGEEELLLIAVDPKYRRQGTAQKMLSQLTIDARARGASRIFLEMRENNPAKILYLGVGFEPIGRRKAYYLLSDGNRMDAITYGLSI